VTSRSLRDFAWLRAVATDAAKDAAAHIAGSDQRWSIQTKSSETDIVTATDLAAERLIREAIAAAAPGSRLLGEESGHSTLGVGPHGDVEWVVDPLDGTVNFAYRIPVHAVSIAAVVEGRAVAGAVVDVQRGEIFSAHEGGGATLDNLPISAGTCTELAHALVATGYAYQPDRRSRHGLTIARLVGSVRDVRCFGSAALHCAWVACGRLDIYVERDIKPWDYAAGAMIAAEAGSHVELPCIENDSLVLVANRPLSLAIRPLLD
jgi:myo-inositol-1(or 4)-monophosphatase